MKLRTAFRNRFIGTFCTANHSLDVVSPNDEEFYVSAVTNYKGETLTDPRIIKVANKIINDAVNGDTKA